MIPNRPAAVAGTFYPRDPRTLRHELDRVLGEAGAGVPARRPKLLVVPHAGYVYSGPIAASAYARLAPWAADIRRVVLLGPAHRVALRGLAAPTVAAFETPLGPVPLDAAALGSLADLPQVQRNDAAHAHEHALEVQLPFLQVVLGGDRAVPPGGFAAKPPREAAFTLVPLVVGRAGAEEVAEVLDRLWGGDETLIVISSDLSHFLDHIAARARDDRTVERIAALATDLDPHDACGAHALNGALLAARRHALRGRVLDVRTSADTAGEPDRVVGYGALEFAPDPGRADETDTDVDTARRAADPVDDARLRDALLAVAANSIASRLGLPTSPEPGHPALQNPAATFVTLHDAGGGLRGCIGRLEPAFALADDVRRNAEAAAFRDPRFDPLTVADWVGLQLEVSLLSSPQPLAPATTLDEAAAALEPGVDGVILDAGGRQATFLPQVWDHLPDPRDFLAALLRKAGLPADRWPRTAALQRYRVRRFHRAARVDA